MDVLRTGVLRAGCELPEKDDHNAAGARDIADRLVASLRLDALLLVSLQPHPAGASRSRPTTTPSAGISCTCCTAARRRHAWVRAMHTSLILYAEHEFNASTFTARVIAGTGSDMYSCITGAHRRAARPEARRRQRSGARDPAALRHARRGARPTSARAWRPRKSSSASAIRSTPSSDPRNRGHQGSRAQLCRRKPAT